MKKYLLLLLAASSLTQAATFNVSTTAELRAALSTAATNGEDDTINLADGTYKTTDDGEGTFVYFSNLTNTLTLEGSNAEKVIISGDQEHQIFNHISIGDSLLILRDISFVDGNNPEGDGGAVFTDHSIEIDSCSFINNTAINGGGFHIYKAEGSSITKILNSHFTNNAASSSGGGFSTRIYYSNDITITGSTFEGNTASIGGAFYESTTYHGNTIISNSIFNDNSATSSAGGIYKSIGYSFSNVKMSITNSEFNRNTAIRNGGAVYVRPDASLELSVMNSIFSENKAENGGSIYTKHIRSINSLFVNNENNIYISKGDNHEFVNSIFYTNLNYDVNANASVIITLKNNYINEGNIEIQKFTFDNIYHNALLEFTNETDNDYRLTSSSSLIDAGTIELSTELPLLDLDGNKRISGGTIDIGPYEFSSTRPTINSVTYTGIAKEQSELVFTVDYALADGRELTEVSYDFLNDGNYNSVSTHTFIKAGTYTINVKVTDSEGEFSASSLDTTITELPWPEMTYEQKLIKAISPEYYDSLLVEIDLEKSNSFATGKQYVQDNLSEFSLVTEAAQSTVVAAATTTGITYGENNVINNPVAYGLNIVVGLSKEGIAQLPSGWKMISIPESVTDLSIFDDAKIVWFFNNETQAWTGYSSNSNTVQQMKDKNIGIITSLNAGDGVFIEM